MIKENERIINEFIAFVEAHGLTLIEKNLTSNGQILKPPTDEKSQILLLNGLIDGLNSDFYSLSAQITYLRDLVFNSMQNNCKTE